MKISVTPSNHALLLVFVLLVVGVVYYPGLSGPFVFDDIPNVLLPQVKVESLSFDALRQAAFASDSGPLGRPISMVSFAVNHYFSGDNTFYFKLTNLLIHIVNGIGLLALTNLLLHQQNGDGRSIQIPHPAWISLAVAAAWLLHPLHLTSVLYVVQRMTSLAAFFTIAALLCYVYGRTKIIEGVTSGFLTILAGCLFGGVFAVLSKETGSLLPLFVLIIEVFFFRLAAHERLVKAFRWSFIGFLLFPLLIGLSILLIKAEDLLALDAYQIRHFTLQERLLTESRAIWIYLKLIFVPNITEMGLFHDDVSVSHSLFEPKSTFLSVMGVLGLIALVPLTFRKLPIISFSIAWFLVGHLLESTVIPLELVHEHRNYLPAFGPILALTVSAANQYQRAKSVVIAPRMFLLIYITLLASATWVRANQWETERVLSYHEARNHPNSARAHVGLAVYLHNVKQFSAAEAHFRKAAELAPHDSSNVVRLCHHLFDAKGDIPEADLLWLKHALETNKFDSVTLWVMDMLLALTVKDLPLHSELLEMLERLAARTDVRIPDDWQQSMHVSLSRNYRDIHSDYARALNHILAASRLGSKPEYYLESANLYISMGDVAKARSAVTEMKQIDFLLNERDKTQLAHLEDFFLQVDKILPGKNSKAK